MFDTNSSCLSGVRWALPLCHATVHALAVCRVFTDFRKAFVNCRDLQDHSADAICAAILRTAPGGTGFFECVALAAAIDAAASVHWASVDK